MKTMSAVDITSAADGGGSNVCELVPSGTMPTISAQSPMTFAAIEVIGATVVTTWISDVDPSELSVAESESLPHAVATRTSAVAAPINGFVGRVDDIDENSSCDLLANTVVLEVDVDQVFRALSGTNPRR